MASIHLRPSRTHYDLVAIGSGPGGQRAAVQAAKLGKRALVIEKSEIGGSCLHTGTIPSKALREAALTDSTHQLRTVMERTKKVISDETGIIHHQLARNGVDYVSGVARFADSQTIVVENSAGQHRIAMSSAVIATGTRPRRPAEIPFHKDCVFDSDSILQMARLPQTMLVIGAGVIGSEYASIFARLGVAVTLMDRRVDLLRSMDQEIIGMLRQQFQKIGIQLAMGYEFRNIKTEPGQHDHFATIELASIVDKSGQANFEKKQFGAILYCMGRVGNVEELALEAAGLKADDRRFIKVNTNYQTEQPHIYAVGDVIGAPALAASSAEQGRQAALHAITAQPVKFPELFPFGIYTIPEISAVGREESQLREQGIDYVVGRAFYRELARGKILGDDYGFLKLLVERNSGQILGVHVIGTGATELVHIGQTAMALGAKIQYFADNVFNYPTLAEAYKVAGYNAINQLEQERTR